MVSTYDDFFFVDKSDPWGSFYLHGLTLIPSWIGNHIPTNVHKEIAHLFLTFNGYKSEKLRNSRGCAHGVNIKLLGFRLMIVQWWILRLQLSVVQSIHSYILLHSPPPGSSTVEEQNAVECFTKLSSRNDRFYWFQTYSIRLIRTRS